MNSSLVSLWRVYCNTENTFVTGYSNPNVVPTVCFNSSAHTINGASQIVYDFSQQAAWLSRQLPSGTSGGTAVAKVWNTLPLTNITSTVTGLSLNTNTNVVTVPAGTYSISVAQNVTGTGPSQLRLYDVTQGSTVVAGVSTPAWSKSSYAFIPDLSLTLNLEGVFTIAGQNPHDLVAQVFITSAAGTPSQTLGVAVGAGIPEVYNNTKITKLA